MWTKDRIQESQKRTVSICGDDVIIRKLKAREVLSKDKNSSDESKSIRMVSDSLLEPQMTFDEVKEMPIENLNALVDAILDFNGMNKEAKQGN